MLTVVTTLWSISNFMETVCSAYVRNIPENSMKIQFRWNLYFYKVFYAVRINSKEYVINHSNISSTKTLFTAHLWRSLIRCFSYKSKHVLNRWIKKNPFLILLFSFLSRIRQVRFIIITAETQNVIMKKYAKDRRKISHWRSNS